MASDEAILRLLETIEELGGYSDLTPTIDGVAGEEAFLAVDQAERLGLIEGRATRSAAGELIVMMNIRLTPRGRSLLRGARGESQGGVNIYGDVTNSVIQSSGAGSLLTGSSSQPAALNSNDEQPSVTRRTWRWITGSTRTVVLGALGAVLAAGIVWFVTVYLAHRTTPQDLRGTDVPKGAVLEYADNHQGSPVFTDAAGDPVTGVPGRINFGTKVFVTCVLSNTSGELASVHAFYLIAAGPWQGDYVVSDTMSNGGPPDNTTSPNVDRRVKPCT